MSNPPFKRLLLVEDNAGDVRLLREMLVEPGSPGLRLAHVQSVGEAETYLASHAVDIILLDLGLPDAQGVAAVRRAHAAAPRVPLVVFTGLDDEKLASLALKEGAQDYLIKGEIETRGLLRALRYAVERKAMEDSLFVEKERAEVTLNSIGDAVACTDLAGNITFLNVVAEAMSGWSQAEASGHPMPDVLRILNSRSRITIANPMPADSEPAQSHHLPPNSVLVRRDGHEIPIEDSVATIHNREGEPTGVRHRLSRCQRRPRDGGADDPFG